MTSRWYGQVKSVLQPGHQQAHHHFKVWALERELGLEGLSLLASTGGAGCDAGAGWGGLLVCVGCCG